MKILNVKSVKGKITIKTDEKSFDVSVNTWARNYLRIGMEINQEDIIKYVSESEYDLLLINALNFLKKRRTENELMEFLINENDEYAKKCFDYCKEKGYLNDSLFCLDYININKDKKGKNLLIHELSERGIDNEIIEDALNQEYDYEEKILENLISKEMLKYHSGSIVQFQQKIIKKMIEKGFSYANVKKTVEENCKILDNIDEGFSLEKDYQALVNKYSRKLSGNELQRKVFLGLLAKGYKMENIRKVRGGFNESEED